MKKSEFCYLDKGSVAVLILLIIILICLTEFFLTLGIIGYLISAIYLIGFIRLINHVVAFDKYFFIIKYFFLWKKVKIEDVIELKCEITGLGRSRDAQIFMYYLVDGNLNKSTFLHFRFTGYKSFLFFLNRISGRVRIDDDSFLILGIRKLNNEYVRE
jgi:hypothetical protein